MTPRLHSARSIKLGGIDINIEIRNYNKSADDEDSWFANANMQQLQQTGLNQPKNPSSDLKDGTVSSREERLSNILSDVS
ncbi:hypothetical protein A2U01_0046576, partial [Trifolium medium]|nr:hypothetical protein [Trifolium medium]